MDFSDDDKAVLALTTRLGGRDRPSLGPVAWSKLSQLLSDHGLSPSVLLSVRPPFLTEKQSDTIDQLTDRVGTVLREAEELYLRGVWVTPISSKSYPVILQSRLRTQAPPVLFGVGERSMLERGGIGVVGSRDVSPNGAALATALAGEAVKSGLQVVSGGARGVDQLAMNATYEAGGAVVGVLAGSLFERTRSPQVLAALDEGNTCLVTQQHPSTGFSPAAAMARNKLIYAIADLTVVVASDMDTGGTWSGATEALSARYGRVAVYRGDGEGPGNRELEKRGASPLSDVNGLSSVLEAQDFEPPTQLRLVD
ncbi:MAG: DNA-processing protein DprA [Acidimicrobiia bacterium]